jgi:hypothetical protein
VPFADKRTVGWASVRPYGPRFLICRLQNDRTPTNSAFTRLSQKLEVLPNELFTRMRFAIFSNYSCHVFIFVKHFSQRNNERKRYGANRGQHSLQATDE